MHLIISGAAGFMVHELTFMSKTVSADVDAYVHFLECTDLCFSAQTQHAGAKQVGVTHTVHTESQRLT